jgi:hypothetical protein
LIAREGGILWKGYMERLGRRGAGKEEEEKKEKGNCA